MINNKILDPGCHKTHNSVMTAYLYTFNINLNQIKNGAQRTQRFYHN